MSNPLWALVFASCSHRLLRRRGDEFEPNYFRGYGHAYIRQNRGRTKPCRCHCGFRRERHADRIGDALQRKLYTERRYAQCWLSVHYGSSRLSRRGVRHAHRCPYAGRRQLCKVQQGVRNVLGSSLTGKYCPQVNVAPDATILPAAQSLDITASVSGGAGTPTGSVVLSRGSYTSASATLGSSSAPFYILPGSLAAGSATLTANYTPNASSSPTYSSVAGTDSIPVTSPGSPPSQ